MAQTASQPPPAEAPRPLPRRGSSPKAVRPPRLVPQDIFWIVALAALALTVSLLTPRADSHRLAGASCAAGTTALLYLLGWRARDRATGIIAGLLLATSLPSAAYAVAAPREALAALLTAAALFAFVAGSSLLALAFAGLAALAQPDGLLLGLLLLAVSLAQRRRRAAWGAAFFLGVVCVGWGMQFAVWHQHLPTLQLGVRDGLVLWAVSPGMVFLTWLLLPFCAELGEAPRRARWLPVVLWTLLCFVVSCFVHAVPTLAATEFALLPLWCVLAAGGLSRLLPAITELPVPWARYLLATLAVLSLLVLRLRAEWPPPAPSRPTMPSVAIVPIPPATLAVRPTAATVAALRPRLAPAPPPAPKPAVAVKLQPKQKPVPKKPVAAAPKPVPVVRAHPVSHNYRYYRPRRTYRYYRHR